MITISYLLLLLLIHILLLLQFIMIITAIIIFITVIPLTIIFSSRPFVRRVAVAAVPAVSAG